MDIQIMVLEVGPGAKSLLIKSASEDVLET